MAARRRAPAPPKPPKPDTRIQKSGNGHSYILDGIKAPGVTTILGDGVPKPALMNWSAEQCANFVVNRLGVLRLPDGTEHIVADDVVADALAWNATRTKPEPHPTGDRLPRLALAKILKDIRYRDLDEASGRGTEVHRLAHQLAHGEEVDVPDLLAGHVRSYIRFLEEWDPQGAMLERVIVNRRYRYMGRLDMIAYFASLPDYLSRQIGKPDGWGLLDIKTSRSGIFAEVALQLEGYRHGETMLDGDAEVPMPAVDFVGAIHVRADGYDVYTFDTNNEEPPTTFHHFLYAKQLGAWLDWKEGRASTIKSPSLPPPRRNP